MASLAALLEADRALLADTLGPSRFTIADVDEDHCRVDTDGLTIHFYRRDGDWPIDSSLELASAPAHAVPLTNHLHTWFVLKSRGEKWPAPLSRDPLADELARVGRAIPVVRDEAMLVETLLWEAGYMNGFAEVAVPWG